MVFGHCGTSSWTRGTDDGGRNEDSSIACLMRTTQGRSMPDARLNPMERRRCDHAIPLEIEYSPPLSRRAGKTAVYLLGTSLVVRATVPKKEVFSPLC